MNMSLPKNTKLQAISTGSRSGFTLIELLVVIAIIAILSVIAISIYFGAQASARDGRRRSEIDSLSKSIEISKNPSNGIYTYLSAQAGSDFPDPARFPQDPTPGRSYCILTNATITAPPVNPAAWTTTCPIGPPAWTALATSSATDIIAAPGAASWKICASLEASTTVVCKSSLTK